MTPAPRLPWRRHRRLRQGPPAKQAPLILHAQALLAALPNGVVLRAPDGRVIDCNPAAEHQLHLTRAQLLGQQPIDAGWRSLHADGRTMTLAERPAMKALAAGQGLHSQVVGVAPPDGLVRWLLVNAEPLRDAAGQPAGTLSCFTDVTDQRSQQALANP